MAVPGLDPGINTAICLILSKEDSWVKPANDASLLGLLPRDQRNFCQPAGQLTLGIRKW
jgi:hypothetical protein